MEAVASVRENVYRGGADEHISISSGGRDPEGEGFESVEVLVDTGATFTVIPGSILRRLGVTPQRTISLRVADSSMISS